MARKEVSGRFSGVLWLLALASTADFAGASIADCVNFDLEHIEKYITASSRVPGASGNVTGVEKDITGSLGRFGTLGSDWTRLNALRDALPEGSTLRRDFNHVLRLLVVADEQANKASSPTPMPYEFPIKATGSAAINVVREDENAGQTKTTSDSSSTSHDREENAAEIPSTRSDLETTKVPYFTFEVTSSRPTEDERLLANLANDRTHVTGVSNESTTPSRDNAMPSRVTLSDTLGSSIGSTSSYGGPDETESFYLDESGEKFNGESTTAIDKSTTRPREKFSVPTTRSDVTHASSSPREEIFSTPSLVENSFTGIQSTTMGLLIDKIQLLVSTEKGREFSTPEVIAGHTISSSGITRDEQAFDAPPTEQTSTKNREISTSHENARTTLIDEQTTVSDWDVSSKMTLADQIFDTQVSESTDYRKIDAAETRIRPPAPSEFDESAISAPSSLKAWTSTEKSPEQEPLLRKDSNEPSRSDFIRDRPEYTSVVSQSSQDIGNTRLRSVEISRDYKHQPFNRSGIVNATTSTEIVSSVVYELGIGAENRKNWRQDLDQRLPPKYDVRKLSTDRPIPDAPYARTSLRARANKFRSRRRGSSTNIGERLRSFYGQFEDRGRSR